MKSKRRIGIIATSVAAVLIGGGTAVAYWTSTGSGTTTATAGTTTSLTVTPAAVTGLVPTTSASASTISADVKNNDSFAVTLTGFNVTIDSVKDSTNTTVITDPCASDFTLVSGTISSQSIAGGATASGVNTGWKIYLNNTASNQNACKNAVVNLTVSAQ